MLELIEQAKEVMIVERVTHLDQLAHKLQEPRVRGVIEPKLDGTVPGEVSEDDRQYLVGLGLLRRDGAGVSPLALSSPPPRPPGDES
jgi:hypothetical protein